MHARPGRAAWHGRMVLSRCMLATYAATPRGGLLNGIRYRIQLHTTWERNKVRSSALFLSRYLRYRSISLRCAATARATDGRRMRNACASAGLRVTACTVRQGHEAGRKNSCPFFTSNLPFMVSQGEGEAASESSGMKVVPGTIRAPVAFVSGWALSQGSTFFFLPSTLWATLVGNCASAGGQADPVAGRPAQAVSPEGETTIRKEFCLPPCCAPVKRQRA